MGKEIKHFTDLIVWQKAHQLFLDAIEDVRKFPKTQAARIVANQLIRSIGSASANTAEGFNSRSLKKYIFYLDTSRNSSSEAENWYYKVRDARWLDIALCGKRIEVCSELQKMLYRMMEKLKKRLESRTSYLVPSAWYLVTVV